VHFSRIGLSREKTCALFILLRKKINKNEWVEQWLQKKGYFVVYDVKSGTSRLQ
jgi:hypothetical protein